MAYRCAVELRHLRYFVATAEELHFGRAAARLLISTPSLSQQIKALEREFGLTLFDRSSAGVALTEAGAALLDPARDALAAAEIVRSDAARLSAGHQSTLTIGFQGFALTGAVRELLTAFALQNLRVEVRLRQYEWDDPSAGILDGQVDVAIVRPPFLGLDRLHQIELDREPVLLAVRAGHPLTRQPTITLADIAGLTFLETRIVTDRVFADHWFLRPIQRVPSAPSDSKTIEEWLGELSLGRGVTIVPASFAGENRRPGVEFLPIEGLPDSSTLLVWGRDEPSEPVRAIVRLAARELGIPIP